MRLKTNLIMVFKLKVKIIMIIQIFQVKKIRISNNRKIHLNMMTGIVKDVDSQILLKEIFVKYANNQKIILQKR